MVGNEVRSAKGKFIMIATIQDVRFRADLNSYVAVANVVLNGEETTMEFILDFKTAMTIKNELEKEE